MTAKEGSAKGRVSIPTKRVFYTYTVIMLHSKHIHSMVSCCEGEKLKRKSVSVGVLVPWKRDHPFECHTAANWLDCPASWQSAFFLQHTMCEFAEVVDGWCVIWLRRGCHLHRFYSLRAHMLGSSRPTTPCASTVVLRPHVSCPGCHSSHFAFQAEISVTYRHADYNRFWDCHLYE